MKRSAFPQEIDKELPVIQTTNGNEICADRIITLKQDARLAAVDARTAEQPAYRQQPLPTL